MDIELVPLCEATATLAEPIVLKGAPFSSRFVGEVVDARVQEWRIRATMAGSAGAEWLLVGAHGTAALDVRIMLLTDDGALVLRAATTVARTSPPERVPLASKSHRASRRGTNGTSG